MKLATIGSCVGADIIKKAADRGWTNCVNYISYSPVGIVESLKNQISIDVSLFSSEPNNDKYSFVENVNGTILKRIAACSPDYILVDLSDLRIPVEFVTFENGKKIAYTKKSLSQDSYSILYQELERILNSKIVEKTLKTAHSMSDDELEEFLISYKNLLVEYFGESRLVFFKPRLVTQYLDGEQILYTPNFKISGETNAVIDRIYSIFAKIGEYIDCPSGIIGDITCNNPFEYHYCQPYYDYMIESILICIDKSNRDYDIVNEKRKNCEMKIHRLYNRIFCNQLLSKVRVRPGREIVLIAKTRQFEEMFKNEFKRDIYSYVEYNEYSDINVIGAQIADLVKEDKNLLFVVPELFRHQTHGLLYEFYENGISLEMDYILPIYHPVRLENFCGIYEDVYNNRFVMDSPSTIEFTGAAISVRAEKQSYFSVLQIQSCGRFSIGEASRVRDMFRVGLDADMTIGQKTTMWQADVTSHSFSSVVVGDDVMTSAQEMIYSGDGHPIFQLQADGTYSRLNRCTQSKIVIGDHVWIGYRCNILGGADIGSGSIIGAGSMVNKKFPNNVLLVGTPAKIIKKDVAWSRNYLIDDIQRDPYLYQNYASPTEE